MRFVLGLLQHTRFDFVRVSQLSTSAGQQTRMGTASFKVAASGIFSEGTVERPLATVGTEWQLSLSEKSPGVWKVTRVQAIRVPTEVARYLFSR